MPGKYDPATDENLMRIRDAGRRIETKNCSRARKELISMLSESLGGIGKVQKKAWAEPVNCCLRAIEDSLRNFSENETGKICGLLKDGCMKCTGAGEQHALVSRMMSFMAMLHKNGRRGAKDALLELGRNSDLQIAGVARDKLAHMGYDRSGNWVRGKKEVRGGIRACRSYYHEGTSHKKIGNVMGGS